MNKKGFVWLPVLLVMLGLALVGGGVSAYMLGKNSQPQESIYQPVDTTSSPQTNTSTQPSNSSVSFSATPISGPAPLTVHFAQTATDNWRASIDYGDGTVCSVDGTGEGSNCPNKFEHTYTVPGTYTVKLGSSTGTDGASRPPLGTVTITVTGSNGPQTSLSVPGMSQYTDTNLGITFYAPPNFQIKTNSTNGVPSNFDYCINMINPADVGKNYPGDDGSWVTICKKQTDLFAEQGYWGDTVYYYFDMVKNKWMYALHGTGSDQPGSSSVATTTATVEALTLAGDPIFVGTGAHSCISRIVPTNKNTFLYIRDRFCSNYDATSFESIFVQTFDRIGHTPDALQLQKALQNELVSLKKIFLLI